MTHDENERQMVICDDCGQSVPRDTCGDTINFDSLGFKVIGYGHVCWVHRQEAAARRRRELRDMKAHAEQPLIEALNHEMGGPPAPASQVCAAIQHEETWLRAAYCLLEDMKFQGPPDVTSDDAEFDGATYEDSSYYPYGYISELEDLVEGVIHNLTLMRWLSELDYWPSEIARITPRV